MRGGTRILRGFEWEKAHGNAVVGRVELGSAGTTSPAQSCAHVKVYLWRSAFWLSKGESYDYRAEAAPAAIAYPKTVIPIARFLNL
jgi:hypothetical protein